MIDTAVDTKVNIYVDESGSMTKKNLKRNDFFVICYVEIKNKKKLKTVFKRYIAKNFNYLKSIDINHLMFDSNGKFKEIKGSALLKKDKIELAKYLCRNNYFTIYYICANNRKTDEKLYKNKARAFNYLLKTDIKFNIMSGNLPKHKKYCLLIDERNVRTDSRMTLEELLNDNLILELNLIDEVKVTYCDSSCGCFIQVADFFANLMYNSLHNSDFQEIIYQLKSEGYIKNIYNFPLINKGTGEY